MCPVHTAQVHTGVSANYKLDLCNNNINCDRSGLCPHYVCAHLDRLEELPPPVPDEPHHDLVVPLVVGPVGLVARGDVPRDHAARPRKPQQLRERPRRYQTLKQLLARYWQCNVVWNLAFCAQKQIFLAVKSL